MTKIWIRSDDADEYTEALNLDMKANAEFYLGVKCCEAMTGRFPETRLEILSDIPPADFFTVGPLFVVSAQLKDVLDDFNVHAEVFPLRVIYHGAEYTERSFYFCNILDCVDCFDYTRGKCTFWKTAGFTDRMDEITKLAVDEGKAAGHHLFRIANGGEYIVCASDRLAARVQELKLTGMRFVQPEDWQFGLG